MSIEICRLGGGAQFLPIGMPTICWKTFPRRPRKCDGRLRSLTMVKFGSVFRARPAVNVIEWRFVTLVDLSIFQ